MAEYIPQVYRGRFGRKYRFYGVRYFQLFVVVTTVPTRNNKNRLTSTPLPHADLKIVYHFFS